jgi:NAD(P) transhydrogenase subunit alpha
MLVSVLKETFPGERRVALVPASISVLTKAGIHLVVESGAGLAAGFTDEQYTEKGAKITGDREELFNADVVLQVRSLGANRESGRADLAHLGEHQVVIGMCDPLGAAEAARDLAATGASVFALELIPRITRAQSMDVLSSMATIAGYKAVLLAANHLPKIFPLMMTAAGTLSAAKVFVIGAGVAGLQAIASSRRMGAVVQAYDVRPAVKEQIESLGAKFVEMELDAGQAEDKGGYAKAMDEAFYQKQRNLMASVVAECDVCITTAAIPGKESPLLVTAEAVRGMRPGSVIVDLAAERGGNCELSQADQTVVEHGVTILGPTNLPAEVPQHASQMFAKNVTTFLLHLTEAGRLNLNLEDEIIRETLLVHRGEVVNSRVREILGLGDPQPAASAVADNAVADDDDVIEVEDI